MSEKGSTKERIERAALALFAASGIDGVSVKQIARRAGVSQGALYSHFESKEDLAWQLFSDNFSKMGHELRQCTRHLRTFSEKILAVVSHIFARFDEDAELWAYVFFARHRYVPRISPRLGNPFLIVRMIIYDAIAEGTIPRQDLDLLTAMVSGIILQVADLRILGRISKELSSYSRSITEACLRTLDANEVLLPDVPPFLLSSDDSP